MLLNNRSAAATGWPRCRAAAEHHQQHVPVYTDKYIWLPPRCRLAPLSEGRIEPSSGHLQCSYHGWTFDSTGRCSNIPQIGDPAAKATACGSRRSCVTAYPTKVWHGLLWVWADSSAEGAALAEKELPSGEGCVRHACGGCRCEVAGAAFV
jgi:nitrite reductase/ring-hydroxylating ferredoxin subunit